MKLKYIYADITRFANRRFGGNREKAIKWLLEQSK